MFIQVSCSLNLLRCELVKSHRRLQWSSSVFWRQSWNLYVQFVHSMFILYCLKDEFMKFRVGSNLGGMIQVIDGVQSGTKANLQWLSCHLWPFLAFNWNKEWHGVTLVMSSISVAFQHLQVTLSQAFKIAGALLQVRQPRGRNLPWVEFVSGSQWRAPTLATKTWQTMATQATLPAQVSRSLNGKVFCTWPTRCSRRRSFRVTSQWSSVQF